MSISFFNTESHNVVDLSNNSLPSAIPLIQENPHNKGKLMVNAQGIDFLKRIGHKIGSISVVGPYRSGKSYLLSRMLNTPDGFELGPTMNACTKGIWLSTKILVPKQANKPAIILLDTEGIGAVTATTEHDTAIATLSILLSSYFIYNSSGVPKSEDLEKLQVFANVAKKLIPGQNNGILGLSEYFPDFMWVIRDHFLEVIVNGRAVSPQEYVENLLKIEVNSLDPDPRSGIKKVLTSSFKSIGMDCIPLPHHNQDILRNMDKASDVNLQNDFLLSLKRVVERSVNNTKYLKSIGSNALLDGVAFAALVEKFVELVNVTGAIPPFKSMWDDVLRSIISTSTEETVAFYRQAMQQVLPNLPLDLEELNEIHSKYYKSALIHFNEIMKGYSIEKSYYDELQMRLVVKDDKNFVVGGIYFEFVSLNETKSNNLCEELVACAADKLKKSLSTAEYDYKNFVLDCQQAFSFYDSNAKGPSFLKGRESLQKFIDIQQDFVKKLEGYSEEIEVKLKEQEEKHFRELEEAKKNNLDNNLLKQMLEDNAQSVQMFIDNQNQSMQRMKEENERNMEQQRKQFEVLLETQGKDATNQLTLIKTQMNEQQKMLLDTIKMNDQQNAENLQRMVEAIKNIPPPEPIVVKQPNNGLIEKLFNIGEKILMKYLP